MRKIIRRDFYTRPTLEVAQDLLGKYIIRKFKGREIAGKILETEAYVGPKDKASHAYGGKVTKRNKAEYLIGGHIYIYLIYGMYWQLNISTYKEGKPECVLIRALEPAVFKKQGINNLDNKTDKQNIINGPGKVCRYLKLDKSFYGEDLVKSKRVWLEDWGEKIKKSQIIATGRIGIDYAGLYWSHRKWRFLLKDYSKYLAKK
jgi:DNA-3-methyladenine glycosylase